jgi:hypothetical protein
MLLTDDARDVRQIFGFSLDIYFGQAQEVRSRVQSNVGTYQGKYQAASAR